MTTLSEHVHNMHVQRYSPEPLRPTPSGEVPSGNSGLLTPEGYRHRHYRPDSMAHPVDSLSLDEDRQPLHRSQPDDRHSRTYPPGERDARERFGEYSSDSRWHRRESDHSEDAQGHEFHHSRPPRHHRERQQTGSSHSSDESANTHDTQPRRYRDPSEQSKNISGIREGDVSNQPYSLQNPQSIGRNTNRTLPQLSEGFPPVIIPRPGTERSSSRSSDSQSGSESRISGWEDIPHVQARRGIAPPIPPVHTGPVSVTAEVRPPRRRRSSRTNSSRRSSIGSENHGSLGEAPTWYQAQHREVDLLVTYRNECVLTWFFLQTIIQPPTPASVLVQQPGVLAPSSFYTVMPPGQVCIVCSFLSFRRLIYRSSQIIAQPQAPLHDALLEILRVSGYPNLSVVSVVIPVRLDISGTTARTSCEHRPTTRTDETDAEPQRMAHERDARPTH